jgi:hypothetical protein
MARKQGRVGLIVKFEVSCNQCWKTIIFTTTGNFIDSIGMAIPRVGENLIPQMMIIYYVPIV